MAYKQYLQSNIIASLQWLNLLIKKKKKKDKGGLIVLQCWDRRQKE